LPNEANEEAKGDNYLPMKFISGGCDGLVKLWTYSKENNIFTEEVLASYNGWVKDVAFAHCNISWLSIPKGYFAEPELSDTFAVCTEEKMVIIFRKKDEKWIEYNLKNQPSLPVKLSWSPNGHSLAVAYVDGKNQIYEEITGGNWEVVSIQQDEQISET
jgi:WD40 repeat protein